MEKAASGLPFFVKKNVIFYNLRKTINSHEQKAFFALVYCISVVLQRCHSQVPGSLLVARPFWEL